MFARLVSGNSGNMNEGYAYQTAYVLMYEESGSSPSQASKSYTVQSDCIAELHLTLGQISSSTKANATISLNNVQVKQFSNVSGEIHNEIFNLKSGDKITVNMRSLQTGYTANYLLLYTEPT